MCPDCSEKLNYHSKKREVKRMKKCTKSIKQTHKNIDDYEISTSHETSTETTTNSIPPQHHHNEIPENENPTTSQTAQQQLEQIFWTKSTCEEEKTREEEFDDYLTELLL